MSWLSLAASNISYDPDDIDWGNGEGLTDKDVAALREAVVFEDEERDRCEAEAAKQCVDLVNAFQAWSSEIGPFWVEKIALWRVGNEEECTKIITEFYQLCDDWYTREIVNFPLVTYWEDFELECSTRVKTLEGLATNIAEPVWALFIHHFKLGCCKNIFKLGCDENIVDEFISYVFYDETS